MAIAAELKRLRQAARNAKKRVRTLKDELKCARKSAKKARKQLRKASAVQQSKKTASSAVKPTKAAKAWKKRRVHAAKGSRKAPPPATSTADGVADASAGSLGSVEAVTPNARSGVE